MIQAPAIDIIFSRLKPRDVGGILDQSFRLYRKHFLVFLAIAAALEVPVQIAIQAVQLALIGPANEMLKQLTSGDFTAASRSETFINQGLYTFASYMLMALRITVLTISFAAFAVAVQDSYSDRPVSFRRSYGQVLRRPGPLLGMMGVMLLVGIGIFGFAGLSGLSTAAMQNPSSLGWICTGFMVGIVAFIFAVYFYVRLQPAVPALVIEDISPQEAIRRSAQLMRGSWWRTVGLLLLLYIITAIVAGGPAALIAGIVSLFVKFDLVISQAVSGSVSILMGAIILPVQLVALTLYYFDLRVRKEGYDLEAAIRQSYPEAYGDTPLPLNGTDGQSQPLYNQRETPVTAAYQPPALGYASQAKDTPGQAAYGQEIPPLAQHAVAGDTPYGNDPLGLYHHTHEPEVDAANVPRDDDNQPPKSELES